MNASSSAALQQRLSEQLQALSQVGETLTLRLLDLEQRLEALELQLSNPVEAGASTGDEDGTLELLSNTEARIARLEGLLQEQPWNQRDAEPEAAPRHLEAVSEADMPDSLANDDNADLDPFPEEAEQPFLDELSA